MITTVPILTRRAQGHAVQATQSNLLKFGLLIPTSETQSGVYGEGTEAAIQQFQIESKLPDTGLLDPVTQAMLTNAVAATTANQAEITGRIVLGNGLPAGQISLVLYSIGYGGTATRLSAAKADALGVYSLTYTAPEPGSNLQVRAVSDQGKETILSTTMYQMGARRIANLVAPTSLHPDTSEFERLAGDIQRVIGGAGLQNLATAQENLNQQDFTLLHRATGWDARLITLAATAAQQTTTTGLEVDLLYALYRAGLPTEASQLALIPTPAVSLALNKAKGSGIIPWTDDQVAKATAAFQSFARKTRQTLTAEGGVSTYGDLLKSAAIDADAPGSAFADLVFQATDEKSDFWEQAGKLGLPEAKLHELKVQGKYLYLTVNNLPLTEKIMSEIGSATDLSQLAAKDYHTSANWQTALTDLAKIRDHVSVDSLIPSVYTGSTEQRLAAYASDLARKVRVSYPTHTVARLVENGTLPMGESTSGVTAFLRAAADQGYQLGKTPLSAFLKKAPTLSTRLPELRAADLTQLKALHRLYQITPSHESLQAALKLKFTSAREIASHTHAEFMLKYGQEFPSASEADLVYRKAQQVSWVIFNFYTYAKQLDSQPPVYALSSAPATIQSAKNAIVEQFPTMQTLFGSTDYCPCSDCQSVLSPAAYFADLLEFLGNSAPNAANYTPLDVLIGSLDGKIKGRRPDLGALPLTCANTNTALPYIDLVNEILEWFVAHHALSSGLAFDTGTVSTADLTAEPQNILSAAYDLLMKPNSAGGFPLGLPFDLPIETIRSIYGYLQTSLGDVLELVRPVDALELLPAAPSEPNPPPYYRFSIFAEQLGLSPAEQAIFLNANPLATWFTLYAYPTETIALHGGTYPSTPPNYSYPPLFSAKYLAQYLGVTYQELADLVTCDFLNPRLSAVYFQMQRFGLDISRSCSYTNQPGFSSLSAGDQQSFEDLLAVITQRSKANAPGFDAKTWLHTALPPNYSQQMLVLFNSGNGCDFSATILRYADGAPATPLDYLKFNLFVRLWKKLGWSMSEVDRALSLFFAVGAGLPPTSDASFGAAFSAAWQTAIVYLAHLDTLNSAWQPTLGRSSLLALWAPIATTGVNPLYAQVFLTPAALNSDAKFDDPSGLFPAASTDPISLHLGGIQSVLGLAADEVTAVLEDAGTSVTTVVTVVDGQNIAVPSFSLINLSLLYRYQLLAGGLNLSIEDVITLRLLSVDLSNFPAKVAGVDPFIPLTGLPVKSLAEDLLFSQTLQFKTQAEMVSSSGFSLDDVQYLLLHRFDPAGKYHADPNVLPALVQALVAAWSVMQTSLALPTDLSTLSEDLLQQRLSALLPPALLARSVNLLTNAISFSASQSGVTPANQLDATLFTNVPALTLTYDAVLQTQTLTFKGALLDWQIQQLLLINGTSLFAGLLNQLTAQAKAAFDSVVSDLLGVWSSLAQYEFAQSAPKALPALTPPYDPALNVGFDPDHQIQWAAYRGVLTPSASARLTTANPSPELAKLLQGIQSQTQLTFNQLLGSLLGSWTNRLTYQAALGGVLPAGQLDPAALATHPLLEVAYDPSTQTQTLTFQGVLTSDTQTGLLTLIPAADPGFPVLQTLLQSVRAQALAFMQTLSANWLSVAAADLDAHTAALQGLSSADQLKMSKGQMVAVFTPLSMQKMTRQLVVKSLATAALANPSFVETLITSAELLPDPARPGYSLLAAFVEVTDLGVSAMYYPTADRTGSPIGGTQLAAGVLVSDSSNPNPATIGSVHFEGYLQVITDGPYRFFAQLAVSGSKVNFELLPPVSAPAVSNPILQYTATKADDEVSQFVTLQGGVLYHFSVDFDSLGTGGNAGILIQGELLPKGPLNQVQLYSDLAMDRFSEAQTLLNKAWQILQVTGLGQGELAYLSDHPNQFNDFKLSNLPTEPNSDTSAVSAEKAKTLFAQLLALLEYTQLRQGVAHGSDALISVWQSFGTTFTESTNSGTSNFNPNTPWYQLAGLIGSDPSSVREIAIYFGIVHSVNLAGNVTELSTPTVGATNDSIRRIWRAWQLTQAAGLPFSALADSTGVVDPKRLSGAADPGFQLMNNLRNACRSQYTSDTWRPAAQAIFDPIRQKKRDALVAYTVRDLQLDDEEQLFEYFLIDPGMEPVVQTSRLRLALSSVQTFVQRCLLNLESHGPSPMLSALPTSINAGWWEWMKRYRVWQANREIFLFPENWMQPELRLDKSDLFQNLESALLQGDVTRDLVEDAFFKYLQGLEIRARLDIVASYLDQSGPPDANGQNITIYPDYTLHVIGRSYGHPHQYFYRTYTNGVWTTWVEITTPLDGDHIAIAVWHNRVNVFWVTFQNLCSPSDTPPPNSSTKVTQMKFGDLATSIAAATGKTQIQVQLNWTEYFQGKWSNRACSDVNQYAPVDVGMGATFTPSDVYLHVSKEAPDAYGNDGPVFIHLDFPAVQNPGDAFLEQATLSFRLTSKNCNPDFGAKYGQRAPENPYNAGTVDATQYLGAYDLAVDFHDLGGSAGGRQRRHEVILNSVNDYALLLCSNPVVPPFMPPADPSYQEAGGLTGPFFFKDINLANSSLQTSEELTFFVQPIVLSYAISQWVYWAVPMAPVNALAANPEWWQTVPLAAQHSSQQMALLDLHIIEAPDSVHQLDLAPDWTTLPTTTLRSGTGIIGPAGLIGSHPSPSSLSGNSALRAGMVAAAGIQPTVVSQQGLTTSVLRSVLQNQTILRAPKIAKSLATIPLNS